VESQFLGTSVFDNKLIL